MRAPAGASATTGSPIARNRLLTVTILTAGTDKHHDPDITLSASHRCGRRFPG